MRERKRLPRIPAMGARAAQKQDGKRGDAHRESMEKGETACIHPVKIFYHERHWLQTGLEREQTFDPVKGLLQFGYSGEGGSGMLFNFGASEIEKNRNEGGE